MTKKQFIKWYAKNSGETVDEILKYHIPLVCNCEDRTGQHFAMISKNKHAVKHHNKFNRYRHK